MDFTVSVIIPAYNVERFIEKTIASVIAQPEVTEIVIVNDGSTDGTELLLDQLQKQNSILKIYDHPNKVNKGRSDSRNLGIQKATCNYIAFLDADDYFLPNRFANDVKVFQENENCDGVYNAVGFHFYRTATKQELEQHQLYTVSQKIQPDFLFEALLSGKYGHFHIDGLTVKKSVFDTIGSFNKELIVAEDTEVFWKMAIKCQLFTGIIDEPLAIRGVHDSNVFDDKELYTKYTIKMFEALVVWCSHNQVAYLVKDDLLKWIWILRYKQKNKLRADIIYWKQFFFSQPQLLFSILSIKYFPLVRFRQMIFPFLYKS
jgi:glycosyltransferase involved in cell wall biosynthesis